MLLMPLVTMLFFPDWVSVVLEEKDERLLLMMKMQVPSASHTLTSYPVVTLIRPQGLRLDIYWLSLWCYDMLLYSLFTGLYLAMQYAAGAKVFEQANAIEAIALLLGWGHAQIGMAVFISSLLSKCVVRSYVLCLTNS